MVTIGNETLTLGVPNGALSLVPSSVGNGETTAQTQILANGSRALPRFPSPAPSPCSSRPWADSACGVMSSPADARPRSERLQRPADQADMHD